MKQVLENIESTKRQYALRGNRPDFTIGKTSVSG
jgi:hypothetical protein